MRRKILSFILALTLMAGMGSIAYAEDFGDGSGNQTFTESSGEKSIDISAVYEEKTPDKVYGMYVAWDNMTFNCTIEDNRIWNPDTHKYDGKCNLKIEGKAKEVTVSNRSNADVKVSAVAEQAEDPKIQGVKLVFSKGGNESESETFSLDDASGESLNTDYVLTVSLSKTEEGPNPEQFRENSKQVVGTVTITLLTESE